jgi:hypothetical protein
MVSIVALFDQLIFTRPNFCGLSLAQLIKMTGCGKGGKALKILGASR